MQLFLADRTPTEIRQRTQLLLETSKSLLERTRLLLISVRAVQQANRERLDIVRRLRIVGYPPPPVTDQHLVKPRPDFIAAARSLAHARRPHRPVPR